MNPKEKEKIVKKLEKAWERMNVPPEKQGLEHSFLRTAAMTFTWSRRLCAGRNGQKFQFNTETVNLPRFFDAEELRRETEKANHAILSGDGENVRLGFSMGIVWLARVYPNFFPYVERGRQAERAGNRGADVQKKKRDEAAERVRAEVSAMLRESGGKRKEAIIRKVADQEKVTPRAVRSYLRPAGKNNRKTGKL